MMLVSSANSIGIVFEATAVGKSLMYSNNSKWPNTEPCGTPFLTFVHYETALEYVLKFFSKTC
jgi:hypothetical protein